MNARIDTSPEAVARVVAALLDWEQFDEGVNNDAREDAANLLQSIAAERDAALAREVNLREALDVADDYLNKLQTPGTEPLNSCNQGRRMGPYIASVRNEAREIWAIVGNVKDHGMTVSQARAIQDATK